ncbi:MAG TPA: sensor histidine kinase [Bacteroidia bacterium]
MEKQIRLILTSIIFFLMSLIYRIIYWESFTEQYPQILLNSFFDTTVSYAASTLIHLVIIKIDSKKRKIIQSFGFFLGIVLILLVSARTLIVLHYFAHTSTLGMSETFSKTFARESFQIFDTYVVIAIGCLSFLSVRIYSRYKDQLIKAESSEKAYMKQQLQLLKDQISPHFLFNTLNNIHYLIDQQNIKARNVVIKLSEILRYQIYDTGNESKDLASEIKFLEDYISIQDIRKETGFRVKMNWNKELKFEIAPLLLIVPLENAFKFSGPGPDQFIEININKNEDGLFCYRVYNSINPFYKNQESSGIGLENLSKRLKIIYGDRAGLTTSKNQNNFETLIWIKDEY